MEVISFEDMIKRESPKEGCPYYARIVSKPNDTTGIILSELEDLVPTEENYWKGIQTEKINKFFGDTVESNEVYSNSSGSFKVFSVALTGGLLLKFISFIKKNNIYDCYGDYLCPKKNRSYSYIWAKEGIK